MNEHDISEQAYKNGYEKGYEDGKRDAVKHGRWVIKYIKNSKYRYCFCSECETLGSHNWKCCPVCEAKMDGGADHGR